MQPHTPPLRFPLCMTLAILLLASVLLSPATRAQNGVADTDVFARMAMMSKATTALQVLTDMMAGRIRFDRLRARAARRTLIETMRAVPVSFRKPRTDPLSRARPDIWTRREDFEIRADTARRAAKQIGTSRLAALRSTLPTMINACLDCHAAYRDPM